MDQLDLGSDAAVCEADAMDFDITIPGATYLWDDNSTNPVRSIDEEGDYWARITLGGCETSDTVHITITPLPLVYLGPDTGLCAGSTLLLNASQPGATYLWNNSSTQGTITAVPGEWNVEVTLNGCTAGDSDDANFAGTDFPVDLELGTAVPRTTGRKGAAQDALLGRKFMQICLTVSRPCLAFIASLSLSPRTRLASQNLTRVVRISKANKSVRAKADRFRRRGFAREARGVPRPWVRGRGW